MYVELIPRNLGLFREKLACLDLYVIDKHEIDNADLTGRARAPSLKRWDTIDNRFTRQQDKKDHKPPP